jgi:uncharacterized phage infection (PIP) family protein YhgE
VLLAGTAQKTLAVTNGTKDLGGLTATSSKNGKCYNSIKQNSSNIDRVCCPVYVFLGKIMCDWIRNVKAMKNVMV